MSYVYLLVHGAFTDAGLFGDFSCSSYFLFLVSFLSITCLDIVCVEYLHIIIRDARNSFWVKFARKMANRSQKKIVKFFHIHWHYHNAFTVGLKQQMPRIIVMQMD